MQKILLLIFLLLVSLALHSPLLAMDRHLHASAGATSAQQLPIFVAKDLGLFEKHGLDVEPLVITGGSTLLQALVGRSIHSANVAAMAPVRAIASGADLAVTATFLNKNLYSFIARKEIRNPADLKGKKIGIANFGGANQFSVLTALKAWNLPSESVQLVPSGNNMARLIAMDGGRIDATVIPNSSVGLATKRGMTVLASIAEIVKEFPDRTVIMERSYLQKERDNAKRFMRALSEAAYRLKTEPELRERVIGILMKRLRIERKVAEEGYNDYHSVFSFPPRTGRRGLEDVLEIVQKELNRPKAEFTLNRFLDESVLDEIEQEGFFKRLTGEKPRR
jgi:ABC-type nitrate/sulfonate/bicarbonate transport system substrate-binding protein